MMASRTGRIGNISYQMVGTRKSIGSRTCHRAAGSIIAVMVLAMAGPLGPMAHAAGETPTGSASGLPIPRFVSLKSDRINVRGGPNRDQDVRWVYTRAGMPVEITAEFENWRRIRDWEGAEGWVYHSLLSGRRTVMIVPRPTDEMVPLYEQADDGSAVAARLQTGVVATLKTCNGVWCRISGKNFDGWVRQERLWGAYPNEKFD
jgi:SH3-like domain-containing protein